MTAFIIIYTSYGEWRTTQPFGSEISAQRHIDLTIGQKDREYNKNISIMPITLPEGGRIARDYQ